MVLALSSFLEGPIFGTRYNGFCTLGSKARPSVPESDENARTSRSKCNVGTLLLASAPCACHLMPLLGSSSLFPASSKVKKTLGPFVQKVLGPPAGTLRGPTCSLYRVLQLKLALGAGLPQFLQELFRGPKRPPGGPQEASKRPPCDFLCHLARNRARWPVRGRSPSEISIGCYC